jgi:hypothetical protein
MKYIIYLLLLPKAVFAAQMYDNIQVVRHENNQITLTAKCENIVNDILSIIDLSKKIENKFSTVPVINKGERNCSANITENIPKKIFELQDRTTAYPGPNCWNTSLYTNNISKYRRATSEEEMTFWMNSPLCHELGLNESELPGDIIAIRANKPDSFLELHGFVYLTPEFSFSKSGYDTQFPYELVASEYVYQVFALGNYDEVSANKKCRRVIGRPDQEECPVYANVFRCMPYDKYLSATTFSTKNDYLLLDTKMILFEKKLSDAVVIEKNFTQEKGILLTSEIDMLEKEFNEYINSHKTDSILWDSIKNRLISFHVQIDLLLAEISER